MGRQTPSAVLAGYQSSSDHWSFHNPVSVIFGSGTRRALAPQLEGHRLLVVTSKRGRSQLEGDQALSPIPRATSAWIDDVATNPDIEYLESLIERLRGSPIDLVLGFGGGSAIDTAKVIAAVLSQGPKGRTVREYIEAPVLLNGGTGSIPIVAVPTTAGTGAEVTPFATVWNHQQKRKLSLASNLLFPRLALVDPDLTHSLPVSQTVSTGLDALNQAFESIWNRNRTPVTELLAARAVGLGIDALGRVSTERIDAYTRSQLAETSVLAGLCISQTRTALCHSISYPLTAHFGISHGLACAFSMRAVAHQVFKSEPLTLERTAHLAGWRSGQDLLASLSDVLDALSVQATCASAIGGRERIRALAPEMQTRGRADNFILPVTELLLDSVIDESLGH